MEGMSAVPRARHLTAQEALDLLVPAVQEAGEIGLRFGREGARTFTKIDSSPVTEADLAIDARLAERLRGVSEAVAWLSEEATDSAERLSKRQVWVVDPIDGTRGFVAGNGEWVISAALVEDGRPIAGVLLRPTTGELYEAAEGAGAFLNGHRLRVTDGPIADVRSASGPKFYVDLVREIVEEAERHASLSSLALRLAFMAEGRTDLAFAKSAAHDWDIAAADIIVREAGGRLTWLDGTEIVYNRRHPVHPALIAAGAERHPGMVALLKPHAGHAP
jgi:myo-inositol-1(or 4)-monophosphatase